MSSSFKRSLNINMKNPYGKWTHLKTPYSQNNNGKHISIIESYLNAALLWYTWLHLNIILQPPSNSLNQLPALEQPGSSRNRVLQLDDRNSQRYRCHRKRKRYLGYSRSRQYRGLDHLELISQIEAQRAINSLRRFVSVVDFNFAFVVSRLTIQNAGNFRLVENADPIGSIHHCTRNTSNQFSHPFRTKFQSRSDSCEIQRDIRGFIGQSDYQQWLGIALNQFDDIRHTNTLI